MTKLKRKDVLWNSLLTYFREHEGQEFTAKELHVLIKTDRPMADVQRKMSDIIRNTYNQIFVCRKLPAGRGLKQNVYKFDSQVALDKYEAKTRAKALTPGAKLVRLTDARHWDSGQPTQCKHIFANSALGLR